MPFLTYPLKEMNSKDFYSGTYTPGAANTRDYWVAHKVHLANAYKGAHEPTFIPGQPVCVFMGSLEVHYLEGNASQHNISQFGYFIESIPANNKGPNILIPSEYGMDCNVWITVRQFEQNLRFEYRFNLIGVPPTF